MGIEHEQMDAIVYLYKNHKFKPREITYNPKKKTPNQYALAAAIGLVVNENAGIPLVMELFDKMQMYGHQAINDRYGNEQGCPDPHSILWLAAMSTIMKWSIDYNHNGLQQECIQYFGEHVNLVRNFWTNKGCRMPCSRAKAPAGMDLKPNWADDSWAYSIITNGESTRDLLKPSNRDIMRILLDCGILFDKIVRRSNMTDCNIQTKLLKWEVAGGFIAAASEQEPVNDPLAWLIIKDGDIIQSGKTLDNFVRPNWEPEVIK